MFIKQDMKCYILNQKNVSYYLFSRNMCLLALVSLKEKKNSVESWNSLAFASITHDCSACLQSDALKMKHIYRKGLYSVVVIIRLTVTVCFMLISVLNQVNYFNPGLFLPVISIIQALHLWAIILDSWPRHFTVCIKLNFVFVFEPWLLRNGSSNDNSKYTSTYLVIAPKTGVKDFNCSLPSVPLSYPHTVKFPPPACQIRNLQVFVL